ncbi:MAG TPA: hypothetical protein VNC50_11755 [Planctomycetia bacterium]|nr:hypothetical protein [Planctomycetia bacterium]
MQFPSTVARVPEHTDESVNEQIHRDMERRVAAIACEGRRAINKRLTELDEEWDVERLLETNAAALTVFGSALALLWSWFALIPLAVGGFLFVHATQGWCPPMPVMRRHGVRTQTEIEQERYALKAIRGDFGRLRDDTAHSAARVDQALEAVVT